MTRRVWVPYWLWRPWLAPWFAAQAWWYRDRPVIRAGDRCPGPGCDGDAGRGGPHHQWVPE